MNKSDSERVSAVLNKIGYLATDKEDEADLIVVNSCAVRQTAMDRVYGKVSQWQLARRQKKLKTILTGCVLEFDKARLADQFDVLLDIRDLGKLPQLLGHDLEMKVEDYFDVAPAYNSKFQAYVPIMTGCDKFCTYCAVPYTRGREVSRPVNEIVAEVRRLVESGCKDITLLGQNVNSYQGFFDQKETNVDKDKRDISQALLAGMVSKKKVASRLAGGLPVFSSQSNSGAAVATAEPVGRRATFPELLQLVSDIPGKFWIRYLTSHPYDMSDELIDVMAANVKIAKQLNLPVQAGSDAVLKKMNRHYSVHHYKGLIKKIRAKMPEISLSTDVIVGFCGETLDEYQGTVDLMREVKYDMAYLAQYSPREGTVAAHSMADTVPGEEKKRREYELNEILKVTARDHNQQFVGSEIDVLVDKVEDEGNGLLANYGKTEHYKTAKFMSAKNWVSQFARVKIKSAGAWGLEGELI